MSFDIAELRAAMQRTLSAGSARITYESDQSWSMPQFPTPQRSPARRVLLGTGKAVGKAIGKAVYRVAARGQDPLHHLNAEGVVDLAGHRSMIDHGSYAHLEVGAEQWRGRSGRSLATLTAQRTSTTSPLWLLDLLGGATSAEDQGEDAVDGEPCRHLQVVASLADASAGVPGGMPSPARDRFEDLLALPVEVWLDSMHLRRIRFTDTESSFSSAQITLTLSDFGVDLDQLDWSRLPTFRSPAEAAHEPTR